MPRSFALAVLLLLCSAGAMAQTLASVPVDSLDMSVPQAPRPVKVQGRQWLVYELHLTQFGQPAVNLSALRVSDAASGVTVASWNGADLLARTRVIGRAAAVASDKPAFDKHALDKRALDRPALDRPALDGVTLEPGERAVVYLEFDVTEASPKRLRHHVGVSSNAQASVNPAISAEATATAASAATAATITTVDGAELEVASASTPMLAPPLRGGPWVAIHAPQWPRGHRRVFYALQGRARLPGRHAIDWVRVDQSGRIARGDADIAAHHLGYGAPVLAVADARVAAVRNGQAESLRLSTNPRHDFDHAAGNYVVLALADGRHATYEHLRPGSIKVGEGDAVRVGQVIGELGFSGDSTGPHLHFHVADGRVPLASEGLPYGLAGFRLLGHYRSLDRLGSQSWQGLDSAVTAERRGELPASNAVVLFPR